MSCNCLIFSPVFIAEGCCAMTASGISTDHLTGPLPIIPVRRFTARVTNVPLQMSNINIVVSVLTTDNINHFGLFGVGVVEELRFKAELLLTHILVITERIPMACEFDRQRSAIETGFVIQFADDGTNLVLGPGFS